MTSGRNFSAMACLGHGVNMTAKRVWTDTLLDKHECGGEEARRVEVRVNGKPRVLFLPRFLPDIEVLTGAIKGDLFFMMARMIEPENAFLNDSGAVLVARRRKDGAWGVHVWHELWPPALGILGLGPARTVAGDPAR